MSAGGSKGTCALGLAVGALAGTTALISAGASDWTCGAGLEVGVAGISSIFGTCAQPVNHSAMAKAAIVNRGFLANADFI